MPTPPKRKKSLSQATKGSKRKKMERMIETDEDRQNRLADQKLRQSQKRCNEPEIDRSARFVLISLKFQLSALPIRKIRSACDKILP